MSATMTLRHARIARPRLSVRGVLGYLAALDAQHRARLYLREMDDRMLADVNLTRADIAAELRRPYLL